MSKILSFWHSTLGKKVVMGLTGLIMVGFLVAHMVGNLQAFLGPEKLDAYGAMLHGPLHEVVLLSRAVLLLAVVLHIITAYQLTMLDRSARPAAYARKVPQAATLASRTLRVGGVLLLVFIFFHLLHFTVGSVHPDFIEGRVFHNLVSGLSQPVVALFYIVAMLSLGLHLFHGAWSSFRTLGLSQASPHPLQRPVALGLALVLWLGFTVIPVAVLLGLLHE